MKEVAKAVGENKEIWKRVEKIKVRGRQPDAGLMHPCREKKKVAWRVVDKVRNYMEEEGNNKLEQGGGKNRFLNCLLTGMRIIRT